MWIFRFRLAGSVSRIQEPRRKHNKRSLRPTQLLATAIAHLGPILTLAIAAGTLLIIVLPQRVRITSVTSPSNGSPIRRATLERSVLVQGMVLDRSAKRIFLDVNGAVRSISVNQGEFRSQVSLLPGMNHIRASLYPDRFGLTNSSETLSFAANIPPSDIRTELTWDGPGDIDLHLVDPNGEECYYQHPATTSGAILDFDNTVADGPEHITMDNALPGTYRVKVVYYEAKGLPPRKVPWTVTLRVKGGVQQEFSGVLEYENQVQDVVSFQVH